MAVTVTLIATADEAQSADDNTLNTTATVTAAVGDWLVVIGAVDNRGAGGTSIYNSCSDSDGINTYITRAEINRTQTGSPGDGVTLFIATAAVTDALTNATITAALSDTEEGKVALVYRLHPTAGEIISFVAADAAGSTGNTTSHSAATVSVAAGDIIFGAAGLETTNAVTGDSDTTNGSWSVIDSAIWAIAGLGTQAVAQYKTTTALGNQSWTSTTTSARDSARSYVVLHKTGTALSLTAAQGQYTLSGTAMTPRRGKVPIVAGVGSYALTGTAATFINSGTDKEIAAEVGSYSLLGTDVTLTHGYKLDATTAGSYALTGTVATLRRALPMVADLGSYAMIGTDATLTKASLTNKVLGVDPGIYALTGTDATLRIAFKLDATTAGVYALTGSAAALVTAANKVLLAEAGSYALVGTDAGLSLGAAPPSVSPLHIGEWPVDKKKRRRREDAVAAEQRARKRFRDAIGRLLEGLPPEFDEPADLDEVLDTAVQASNLLYAMSAPIREINAVNELIDHIRQLRIAQPIAQLAMAQAYNQAHRHLRIKDQEDAAMTLLLDG